MGFESIRLETLLPATAAEVYAAWLDSDAHGEFTGGRAEIDPRVGGLHSAWNGYIAGRTLALEHGRKIEQSWRASDFPAEADDSLLVVELRDVPEGCLLTLAHTGIPEGLGTSFEQGWEDHYFVPMRTYFGGTPGPKVAAKKPAVKKGAPVKKGVATKGAKTAPVTKGVAHKRAKALPVKKGVAKKGAKPAAKTGVKAAPVKKAPAKKSAAKKGAKALPVKKAPAKKGVATRPTPKRRR